MRIFIFLVITISIYSNSIYSKERHTRYSRKLFPHWIDDDRDCQNTRHELLIERSLVAVTYRNKKKCSVDTGKWNDFYYPEVHTKAAEIDIDHVVPLKHAFDNGAADWNRSKKRQFANDPLNLVITQKKYNRQKGAKTPMEWTPVKKDYACKYYARWKQVKEKYSLPLSPTFKQYYQSMKCI